MNSHSSSPKISVVIPALNEAENLRRTLEQLQATLPPASEIVVVDDGSRDNTAEVVCAAGGPARLLRSYHLGCAAARNYGATQASGEILVFADAHVETPPGWWQPLVAALSDKQVGAVAPAIAAAGRPDARGYGMGLRGPGVHTTWLKRRQTTPYPVPVLCACFVAMRREAFEATGGFDNGLIRWGSTDAEFSIRHWLMGYRLLVVPEATVAHLFRKRHPYKVDWTTVLHNMLRLAFLHFNAERAKRVVEAIKTHRSFAAALALCADSDLWSRRAVLHERRTHDDDWFFNHFGIAM